MSWGVATQNGVSVSLASIVSLSCGATEFSPASLFTSGVAGAWYDPSDYSTLFQDSAGTTPVTAVEQPVGLMLDKSQGLVLGSELVTNGDFASATGWTLGTFGTGATGSVSGGVGNLPRIDGSNFGYLAQTLTGSAGWYRANITVANSSVSFRSGGADLSTRDANIALSPGTYTLFFYAQASNPVITVNCTVNGATATVDGISVKSIAGNHASQATAASRPVLRARYNLLTYSNQADNAAWTKSNSFVQTNLLTYSQDFDNAAWAKLNASVVADSILAPNGTITADTVTSTNSASATAGVYKSLAYAAGHTLSIYAKANTSSIAWVSSNTGESYGVFNLATGTVIDSGNATASIAAVPGYPGWYRLIVANTTVASTYFITGGKDSYTSGHPWANGTWTSGNSIYLWGAQLVQGSVPGDYRATTSAALPCLYADYNGALRARKLCEDATASVAHRVLQAQTTSGISSLSVFAKAAERTWVYVRFTDSASVSKYAWFNLATGALGTVGSGMTGSIQSAGNGYYRCTLSGSALVGSNNCIIGAATADGLDSYTGDGSSGIYIADAQLWQGSVPGNYQNINAATDYATAGFLPYLALDGTDDSFATNSIDFSATDKMSVCAGVTKLSDAAAGMLVELSANTNLNNGAYFIAAPDTANTFYFASKGTAINAVSRSPFASPISAVLTLTSNIAAPSLDTRVNTVASATSTSTQGTGNYGNYPLYIGRRGGASLPFNGRIYQMVVCGKALSASELAALESFTNSKTGAY